MNGPVGVTNSVRTPPSHPTTYHPTPKQPKTNSLRSSQFPLARFLERQQKKGGVADMGDPRVRIAAHLDVDVTRALGPGLVRQCEAFLGRVVEVGLWVKGL